LGNAGSLAFYDFDGTLVSSNVVTRYAFFAKNHPAKLQAAWRYGKVVAGVPLWLGLDAASVQ
jgi:phosphoserine phosphatase